MTIQVECQCGRQFAVQDHLAGKRIRCPICESTLTVSLPQAEPAAKQTQPPATGQVRCSYCHEYVPRLQYDQHVQQHLQLRKDGQQTDYATLPPEERETLTDTANAPQWYRHRACDEVTGMPEEIIQTYLANPWFYLSDKTFCTGCGKHVPQRECVWEETGENLQTYTDRLRAEKPELRPGLLKRTFAAVVNSLFKHY